MGMLKTIQDIHLELMRRTSFNEFDGKAVVSTLLENGELWDAVMMDRPAIRLRRDKPTGSFISLIKLRDIPDDYWNVDTVYVLTTKDKADRIRELFDRLSADEVYVIQGERLKKAMGSMKPESCVVAAWWD